MKAFVFRAEAALDLRKRQDDEAQRALAAAEDAARLAERARDAARGRLEATIAEAGAREREAGALTWQLWYRNWIDALRRDLARREQVLQEQRTEVRRCAARAIEARRKRKSLERYRERSLVAWQDAAAHEEQQAMDELATLRFTGSREARGDHHGDQRRHDSGG
jgi:flagellar export protein FliJ